MTRSAAMVLLAERDVHARKPLEMAERLHPDIVTVRSLPGAGAELVGSRPLHADAQCHEGTASA